MSSEPEELQEAVRREIEQDRRSEFRLIPQAVIALTVVAAIVAIRLLLFP